MCTVLWRCRKGVIRGDGKEFKGRDVYNINILETKKMLAGKSPIQALVKELEHKDTWVYTLETDGKGVVTRLFFSAVSCRDLALRFHYVLLGDCAYKTNM